MGECFEIWALLRSQNLFLMTCCFDPEPTIFLSTLETTKIEFERNPVNLSKKCCHTKEALVLPKEWGICAPWGGMLPCGRNYHVQSGVTCFDRYGAGSGIQLWVDGPDVRSCFERQDEEERVLFLLVKPSLVCLFPASTTNLYHNCTRRLLSVTV